MITNNNPVRSKVIKPNGKKAKRVRISINGVVESFGWNSAFRVYNSNKNYHQLTYEELKNIIWE